MSIETVQAYLNQAMGGLQSQINDRTTHQEAQSQEWTESENGELYITNTAKIQGYWDDIEQMKDDIARPGDPEE